MSTKKVYQYDLYGNFLKEHNSMTKASKDAGVQISGISLCCNGKSHQANGFQFSFIKHKKMPRLDDYIVEYPKDSFSVDILNEAMKNRTKDYVAILSGPEEECWEIISHKSKGSNEFDTYPRIRYKGKREKISRVIYTLVHKKEIGKGNVIMHACDNPACVNPKHLIEGTQKENVLDMLKKGRAVKPPRTYDLPDNIVLQVFNSNESYRYLAEKYNISEQTVSDIKTGKNYSSVTKKEWSNSLLKETEVIEIYNSKEKGKVLAVKYNVHESTISAIRKGRNWAHITKHKENVLNG